MSRHVTLAGSVVDVPDEQVDHYVRAGLIVREVEKPKRTSRKRTTANDGSDGNDK